MSNPHIIQLLQTRIAEQKQDLETLFLDNQTLVASHVTLKNELDFSRSNIQILANEASKTRAKRDAEIIDLIEKLKKRNEDVNEAVETKKELERVRFEMGKFEKGKLEMEEKVGKLKEETEKLSKESGKVDDVKREIEYMRNEVDRGRAAIEYEKKVHTDYLLHRQRMEENIFSMAREVEQLRCELADAAKRARAVAAVATTAAPDSQYQEIYGSRDRTAYDTAYESHQFLNLEAPVAGETVHQFLNLEAPFSMQQTQSRR